MKQFFTILALLAFAVSANAQSATRTIFRYGEEVRITPDTIAQPKKLTATASSGSIYLGWAVSSNSKTGIYVIERSVNGNDYEVIGFKKGVASSLPVQISFYFTDREPVGGKASYKVTHIAEDNTFFEFEPVTIKRSKTTPALTASSSSSSEIKE
jgi:hypothetical protein